MFQSTPGHLSVPLPPLQPQVQQARLHEGPHGHPQLPQALQVPRLPARQQQAQQPEQAHQEGARHDARGD